MGFSEMFWGAEKLVPAEYWCPYGTFSYPVFPAYHDYKASQEEIF